MSQTPHQVCCFGFRSGKGKRKNCSSQLSLFAVTVCIYWVLGIPGYGTYVCLCEPLHFACYCTSTHILISIHRAWVFEKRMVNSGLSHFLHALQQ